MRAGQIDINYKQEKKADSLSASLHIEWNENKALWSKKNQKLIGTDGIRRTLDESTRCGHRNRKHNN